MADAPILLALDTSGPYCAAALFGAGRLRADRHEPMTRGQAERLMPMTLEMMDDAGVAPGDLTFVAVGIGPGNFTGIRIAVAAARGLALGAGIPAMGVSNFEVMRGPESPSDPDPQVVYLPAPRDACYVQPFRGGAPAGPAWLGGVGRLPDLPPDWPDSFDLLGHEARETACLVNHINRGRPDAAAQRGPLRGHDAMLITHAPVIAEIAHRRWTAGDRQPDCPAPLYVRPPDATPVPAP